MSGLQIPSAGENNLWYRYTGSDTVLVLLHGIFSDSRGCWLYEGPKKGSKSTSLLTSPSLNSKYWPDLIATDSNFGGLDIFLGGFYTAFNAADYDLIQCSLEVYRSLNRTVAPANESIMSKKNLIFLGHSTGGIVARYLLERNQIAFREKNIGVVLIASPSAGSIYANWFDFLSKIYKNELGGLLIEGSTILADLDSRFQDMAQKKKEHIPNLIGTEACENHMVLRRKIFGRVAPFIPPVRRLVDARSAFRYFGQGTMLRDTDHFSTVKPSGVHHPAHEFLQSFWIDYQKEFPTDRTASAPGALSVPIPILVPPLPPDAIIGRDGIFAKLKKKLLAGGSHSLEGPTNTGKTSLALQLAHDEELRTAYPDGVLWGELNQKGSAGAVLASWAEAAGVPRSALLVLKRPQDRAVALAKAVGERRMLLIADHCDSIADATLFNLAGPNCARLLTTARPEVASDFAGPNVIHLDILSDEEALDILDKFAPSLHRDRSGALALVRALKDTPAQIAMLARMLESAPGQAQSTLELFKRSEKESG